MTPPSSAALAGDDPTVTDPDKYKFVMENDRVRVLRYHDEPGARTHQHHHPDSVLYALSAFRRRLIFPDGTTKEREFKAGDTMWVPAQTHIGENNGSTDTEVLLVEVKPIAH
jgi:quercetin dioxygenase-like cupin family protein